MDVGLRFSSGTEAAHWDPDFRRGVGARDRKPSTLNPKPETKPLNPIPFHRWCQDAPERGGILIRAHDEAVRGLGSRFEGIGFRV